MTLLKFQKMSYYPEFTVPQEARQSQISPNKYANDGVTDPRDTRGRDKIWGCNSPLSGWEPLLVKIHSNTSSVIKT